MLSSLFNCQTVGDHPRACGENELSLRLRLSGRGSPPRMRGKQLSCSQAAMEYGITPAHAGKTGLNTLPSLLLRDHPRACGENCLGITSRRVRQGSPPRMRGKHLETHCDCVAHGITPAHAGKTVPHLCAGDACGDHPRACGENMFTWNFGMKGGGSPPRMRGKLGDIEVERVVDGITPAHAGKTVTKPQNSRSHRDHPRACGENEIKFTENEDGEGSPPRMRGKRRTGHRTF